MFADKWRKSSAFVYTVSMLLLSNLLTTDSAGPVPNHVHLWTRKDLSGSVNTVQAEAHSFGLG